MELGIAHANTGVSPDGTQPFLVGKVHETWIKPEQVMYKKGRVASDLTQPLPVGKKDEEYLKGSRDNPDECLGKVNLPTERATEPMVIQAKHPVRGGVYHSSYPVTPRVTGTYTLPIYPHSDRTVTHLPEMDSGPRTGATHAWPRTPPDPIGRQPPDG